jgi:uncharacterized protein (TIGR04255 family)
MPEHEQDTRGLGDEPSKVEVFARAPVVEAILSFRFPPLDNLSDTIPLLAEDLRKHFTPAELVLESTDSAEILLGIGQDKGFRFRSQDGRQVLRLTRTAFSFHRLAPYGEWTDLASGASAAWDSVRQRYVPEYVLSVSLRYLNEIPMHPMQDLAEYIVLCPNIPPSIDTGFDEYLLRLALRDRTVPARAEITQIANLKSTPRTLTFDIEVTSDEAEFQPESSRLWEQVARLREYKNRIFFASITERCRELFR